VTAPKVSLDLVIKQTVGLMAGLAFFTGICTSAIASDSPHYKNIEWPELMSPEDLAAIEAMPPIDHGSEGMNDAPVVSEDDPWEDNDWGEGADEAFELDNQNVNSVVANAIKQAVLIRDKPDVAIAYEAALVSTKTRAEFNNTNIRLAGFIVPIEFDGEQNISEFFLVPYFGACIHLPPPPPNQIIHVTINTSTMKKGFKMEQLYEPVWISGKIKSQLLQSTVATSAYSMVADNITPYTEY
jgi:hypothetical protein